MYVAFIEYFIILIFIIGKKQKRKFALFRRRTKSQPKESRKGSGSEKKSKAEDGDKQKTNGSKKSKQKGRETHSRQRYKHITKRRYHFKRRCKHARILMIGLDAGGKTSILQYYEYLISMLCRQSVLILSFKAKLFIAELERSDFQSSNN